MKDIVDKLRLLEGSEIPLPKDTLKGKDVLPSMSKPTKQGEKHPADGKLVGEAEGERVDMTGKTCEKCKKGTYKETGFLDDFTGVQHCDKCGHEVKRWRQESPVNEDENELAGSEVWYKGRLIGKVKKIVQDRVHFIPNARELPEESGRILSISRDQVSIKKNKIAEEGDLSEEMLHSKLKKQFLDFLSAPEEKSPKQKGKEAIDAVEKPKKKIDDKVLDEAKLGGAFEITVGDIFKKAGGTKEIKKACQGKSPKYAMKYLEAYVKRAIWQMRHKASHVSFRGWPEIEKWCKRNFKQITESFLLESDNYYTGDEFEYKGVSVVIHQDAEGFYWINYNPKLPKDIDLKFNKGTSVDSCAEKAKKAIDLAQSQVNEEVSRQDLNYVEDIANSLWNKLGIDINFTKHFFERVNSPRNSEPITTSELIRLFKKEYSEYGDKIKELDPRSEAVMNDLFTKINVPFVIQKDPRSDEKDLIAKTVMRNPNFKTRDPKFQVENLDEGFFGQGIKRANEKALTESNDIKQLSTIINKKD